MGKEKKLSRELMRLGFFCAAATIETSGGVDHDVRNGDPKTWDINNGVLCAYDEKRSPWITSRSSIYNYNLLKVAFEDLLYEFGMKRGAYVPHSNDSGAFILQIASMLDEMKEEALERLGLEREQMRSGGRGEITAEILGDAVDSFNRRELTRSIYWHQAERAAEDSPAFQKMPLEERKATLRGFVLALMLEEDKLSQFVGFKG